MAGHLNCTRGPAVAAVVEAIRAFAATRGLAGPGLVAVSGGADSVALLRGLHNGGPDGLTVAHFNHRLRGAASDADEAFVRELAGRFGLAVRVGSADVAAAGGNLEATARRLRYDWLAGAAAEVGAGWVATGHTADDQAETVLHRLIRGTGLQGLRGVAAERLFLPSPPRGEGLGVRAQPASPAGSVPSPAGSHPSPPSPLPQGERGERRIVRPLLTVTRADVLAYLAALGQPHRTDATNADPAFTRARIRHELLPLLKTFNPAVVDVLGRLARQADEAHAALDAEVTRVLPEVVRPPAGRITVLDAARLTRLPTYLARELLRTVWRSLGWPMDATTAAHWDRLLRIAEGAESAADFPGGVHVRRVGAVVQLSRRA